MIKLKHIEVQTKGSDMAAKKSIKVKSIDSDEDAKLTPDEEEKSLANY